MATGNPLSRVLQAVRRLSQERSNARQRLHSESPLRAQLFSAEQMERHGKALATMHRTSPSHARDLLLARLSDNQKVLERTCDLLGVAARDKRRLTPANEWLLDNIYLIEEQIRIARRHLPKGYSRELPRLVDGPSAGLPRVYDIALNAISHGDGRIDAETLGRFIAAYQTVTPLKLGELWAIPIMLRLALIENLRRVSARIIIDRTHRSLADSWADRFNEVALSDPKDIVLVIADMVRSEPPVASAFVAELTRRLQGQTPSLAMPLTWIEQWLADGGHSVERMVESENRQQAADQVSISNSIGSLRYLERMDWREFVEGISVVDGILRQDPAGTYRTMDFATRDNYRHVVERIARHGGLEEREVAQATLALAMQAAGPRSDEVRIDEARSDEARSDEARSDEARSDEARSDEARSDEARSDDVIDTHVGYYLIDDGRGQLEAAVSAGGGLTGSMRRTARRIPLLAYTAPILAVAVLFTLGLVLKAQSELNERGLVWLVAVLCVIAFSELGVTLVNLVATLLATPRVLPRLDFSHGIPIQARTAVVVPTMFGDVATLEALVEGLEVRFLANRDPNLRFVLLTDFFDADAETLPGDDRLLAAAQQQIDALNARHANGGDDLFLLMHRPRSWNPCEGVWMGLERKRGKLAAFNAVLRNGVDDRIGGSHGDDHPGGHDHGFSLIAGNPKSLAGVRYVITLDTDTSLPRGAAAELSATLAHPLNQARFDPRHGRVTRGYTILQPRVGVSMSSQRQSWYARLYGSEPGIDPYTRAVSDVYQDLFLEGSFVGKGIYDVAAFERVLEGRFPDNSILSHDLLEGCYARAGLVSDVQLYESYPARYAADVKRRHRWIRGDWQLLPWLLPTTRRRNGMRERNALSMLSQGKLLDNLRRSLVPTAITALLLMGWLLAPTPLSWTLWVLAILVVPPLVASLRDVVTKPTDLPLRAHLQQAGRAILRNFSQVPLVLACLPFEAFFSLDAIVRTLWRLFVSRRHLLQWSPSSEVERTLGDGLSAAWRVMWIGPVAAIATAVLLLRLHPSALLVAGPFLLLWFSSPALMWWLGRPRKRRPAVLSSQQVEFLGRLARRTWAFFETWVTEADHWLPPDNVQEHPMLQVAHRTSPTNIGLSLLANLSAYDFGYQQVGGVIARTAPALETIESLPRHRGHLYNWYDTGTLEPLPPLYVSTVDSGNFAGHLLTLRQGLLALVDAPLLAPCTWQGLVDTCAVLVESFDDAPLLDGLPQLQRQLDDLAAAPPPTLQAALRSIDPLLGQATRIHAALAPLADERTTWADALRRQCVAIGEEIRRLAPWAMLSDECIPAGWLQRMPALHELVATEAPPALGAQEKADWQQAGIQAQARILELERLAHVAGQLAQMDFGFLYDRSRHLLSIGYNVTEHRLDAGYYDLLASEARLANFVAIAQNQLPQESWFSLGRLLTEVDGDPGLLSWSGSMFEYLMPQLVMPSYEGTLLDQTSKAAVQRQVEYGQQRNVPWGISESGYNIVDAHMNYQYRAFGVPGLGLRRGLAHDLVIAPYASMMALMVSPEVACSNLQRLSRAGFGGRLGLYEAIDYTPERLPRGQDHAVIRSYMAHHQGMGLLSLDYLLRDQPMQKRFVADPEFQSTLLLLQERIPRTGAFHPHTAEASDTSFGSNVDETRLRIFHSTGAGRPAVQMLSNGRYHVMLSNAGSGYSRSGDLSVTRWREDATRDPWGSFCYLRDVDSGEFWSTAYQPTAVDVDGYEAIFSDAKIEFRGRKRNFETHIEIAVSPEDDIELRRLKISNLSRKTRTIEVTTYAEVVLAPAISDELHPAFSNLFVQTALDPGRQAIVCTRRPRSVQEKPPWMFHLLKLHDAKGDAISYETDRARFVGRGNDLRRPQALVDDEVLSGSAGSVLDPVIAIRCRITLAPEQVATVDMVTGVAADHEACDTLIDKYRDRRLADRVFDLAWTHSQVVRRQINATQADAQLYERMAGLVLHAHPALRADPSILLQNRRGQSGLWGQAISGDHPVVLLRIANPDNIELVRQMVQAHAYWRLKGLTVDLVIWNDDQGGYRQQLQDQIMGLISAGVEAHALDRPGGIFVRAAQQLPHEDRILLQSVARLIISDAQGTLAEQVRRPQPREPVVPLLTAAPTQYELMPAVLEDGATAAVAGGTQGHAQGHAEKTRIAPDAPGDVLFDPWPFDPVVEPVEMDNGLGGFSADGREYVIDLAPGRTTPAPWSNVLANPDFGCVVSESTPGYSWGENAHEFRLTPWHDDPVTDASGEAFYLRDEDTGQVWSPQPLPCRGQGHYRTRHGFGYSVYEHVENGIASELWIYVAVDDAVKYSVLKLRNVSGRRRRLSATGYVEWILGDLKAKTRMHVVCDRDADSGALTARNPYNSEFAGRMAFFDADGPDIDAEHRSFTTDRVEFIGRNGSLRAPDALLREHLSGKLGAGLDPCAAIQLPLDLEPGHDSEIVFRLGMASQHDAALGLARRIGGSDHAHDALDAVRIHWLRTLGAVQVETPDAGLDALANGWLLYQTIACRYFARSGYYQSGGAFGFRDQLQDSMAMLHAEPALARQHLLRCAAHQFPEGDVQHWWHPPMERGVRTRCSDDYLWLPLVACRYIEATADEAVLDEVVHYLEGRPVNPDEESYYDLPTQSALREPLYQHCVRAVDRALGLLGGRGLPLMRTGDWNDGMNRVGDGEQGESVWLGFFLYDVLTRFGGVAHARGDLLVAERYVQAASTLRDNLDQHAWDGQWYRRAWFDNGAPLGSTQSDECRIDSIAQSWSVLSGAGRPERARQAMDSLDMHLVRREAGLVQLLDPPFDKTPQDPGYIRGYVPGVRENGGQYTHAAIWATMAFAKLGDQKRAWELLRLIDPGRHGNTPEGIAQYKVEPYVVAADVYGVVPHTGRGGWTWYTGSAGWMYRLIIESLLGIHLEGKQLRIAPCIPADWPEYRVRYRHEDTVYRIRVSQSRHAGEGSSLSIDGVEQSGLVIALGGDHDVHDVEVILGQAMPPEANA